MPRIRRELIGKSEIFVGLSQEALLLRETNDCTVKALAVAANVDYATAHRAMAAAGRKPGRGATGFVEDKAYAALKIQRVRIDPREMIARYGAAHQCLKSVTTHHPDRFRAAWNDGCTYLLYSRGHVSVVKGGVLHDWARGRALRVYAVYKVVTA